MPAHHRRRERDSDDQGADSSEPERRVSGKAQGVIQKITSDIKALNSSILVISQKIKYVVRNEKILGRNLLVLNKKIKALQESGGTGQEQEGSSVQAELAEINRRLGGNASAIAELQSDLENMRQTFAKAEDVSELKYVIDSINPLEFATMKDVKELLHEKAVSKSKK